MARRSFSAREVGANNMVCGEKGPVNMKKYLLANAENSSGMDSEGNDSVEKKMRHEQFFSRIKKLVVTFCTLSVGMVGFAKDVEIVIETVSGVEWSYQVVGGSAIVANGSQAAISDCVSGDIVVPSTLGGCPVTGIGVRSRWRG